MRWLGIAVLASLPLKWFVVGSTPLGMTRLHQAAFLLAAAIFAFRRPLTTYLPVLRTARAFVLANVAMVLIWTAVSLYNGMAPRQPVQVAVYLGVFVVLGSYFYRAATGQEAGALALLRWGAAAASGTLIVALVMSMMRNGVNPIGVFQQTIATGNPEILQRELFRSSFVGYGYDAESVQGNIRHEVFGAILLSMYVSVWADRLLPAASAASRWALRASLALSTALLLVSMSRAVLIAAAAWPLLSLARSAMTFKLSRRQLVLAYVGLCVLGLAIVSGIAKVLWTRFTEDTSSYEARTGLYDQAWEGIRENFFTGGVNTQGESSHNFVVDAWLRGGVLVALCAAALLIILLLMWGRLLARLTRLPEYMVVVAVAFALPIDRMLTAGGGLIPPVSWMTLAFIAGSLAFYQRSLQPRTRPPDDRRSHTQNVLA